MMSYLEAEDRAEAQKRPLKRNLIATQQDHTKDVNKRKKVNDQPGKQTRQPCSPQTLELTGVCIASVAPDYILPSERIRGWTSPDPPDEPSPPCEDPVQYSELEVVSRQVHSPSPDAMDIGALPSKDDPEPLFFSRPSSVIGVDSPANMTFDTKADPLVLPSKPVTQPSDADPYSYFLDLDDLIVPESDPMEVEKPVIEMHDKVDEETEESSQEESFKRVPMEYVDTLLDKCPVFAQIDRWEEKPAFDIPVDARVDHAFVDVPCDTSGHTPNLTEPPLKAEEPLPVKPQEDLFGSDMADFDSWFADGNIEIVD
jgi:hypothetical protein